MCVALITLTGVAGDYLRRLLNNHPNANWDDIRQAVVGRFSDLADQHYALNQLKKMKQETGESVQAFGERLLSLAEDAYPRQAMNQPALQRELIDVFIEGLRDDRTAKKLLRHRPVDIFQAIDSAMEEQQVQRVFRAQRRTDEPMDIDLNQVLMNKLTDRMEGLLEAMANKIVDKTRPQAQSCSSSGTQKPGKYRYTSDKKPICNYCNKVGHMYRECRSRLAKQGN